MYWVVGIVLVAITVFFIYRIVVKLNEDKSNKLILKYDTISNVLAVDPSTIEDTYTNLSFKDNWWAAGLSAGKPEEVYEYTCTFKVTTVTPDEEILDKISLLCSNLFKIDLSKETSEYTRENSDCLNYEDEMFDIQFYEGKTVDIDLKQMENMVLDNAPIKKRINLRLDGASDEVVFSDGHTLSEYFEENIEEVLAAAQTINFADDLIAGTALKLQDERGTVWLVRFHRVLEGLALDDAGGFEHVFAGMSRPTSFDLSFDEEGNLGQVENRYSVSVMEKTLLENRVLTLKSAFDLLEEYLAPYGCYTICEGEMKYCAIYHWQDDPEKNNVVYRPMWCFTVGYDSSAVITNFNPRKLLYVDACNGKVYICDNTEDGKEYFDLREEQGE